MDTAETSKASLASLIQDVEKSWDDELQQLVHTLPREESWVSDSSLYLYQGFWCPSILLKPMISFHKNFQPFDCDVIIAPFPKCGTTWLKALIFSVLYRDRLRLARDENPLQASTPHQLVRFFELDLYFNDPCPDLENICVYKPRLFATHVPHASLPSPIKDSECKIVYMCRNPLDMFVSLWLFSNKLRDENREPLSLDKVFDKFCHGICPFGPFFEHVLGYWNAGQENADKILFLKYEDLKEDISCQVKHLAMFLGVPFTEEEEKQGVVGEIAKVCSFENLKELEVNKKGLHISGVPHKDFFRQGKVGDWSNYLTPAMVERLEKLIQQKLDNSGLTFKLSSKV